MRVPWGKNTGLVTDTEPEIPDKGRLILEGEFEASSKPKNEALGEALKLLVDEKAILPEEEDVSRLCLDEGLANAVEHGSKHDSTKTVKFRVWILDNDQKETDKLTSRSWLALIEDAGSGFREEDLPDPNAPENLTQEGGRGVFLIKHYMDKVKYYRGGRALWMKRAVRRPSSDETP